MSKVLLEYQIREIFATNIKQLRKSRKLTQARFAEAMQIEQKRVGAWEEGRAFPPMEYLIQIADLFNQDLRKLLTENICQELQSQE